MPKPLGMAFCVGFLVQLGSRVVWLRVGQLTTPRLAVG